MGRWSPTRLLGGSESHFGLEPRLWVAGGLLLLLLTPIRRSIPTAETKARQKRSGRVFFWGLLFLVYMMFSVGWAPDLELGLNKVYEISLVCVSLVAVFRWLIVADAEALLASFWKWLVLLTGILAFLAILTAVTTTGLGRVSVLAGGPNTFGRMMGLLCLGSLLAWRRIGWTALCIPVAVMATFLVVFSGSRGAMIAITLALVVFVLAERIRLSRMVLAWVFSVVVGVGIVWYSPVGATVSRIFQYRVIDLTIEQRYMSGRESIFLDAWDLGLSHPFFGAGLAGFPAQGIRPYPHNIVLEAFSEGGTVGVIVLMIFLVSAFRTIWRHRRVLNGATVAAAMLSLTFSQFSGDFYDNRTVFLFLLLSTISAVTVDQRQDRGAAPQVQGRLGHS